LFKATGTSSYLTYAINGYSSYGISGNIDVLSWDSKFAGVKVLIAQLTGQATYIQDVANLCNNYMSTTRSPLGEAFFSQWGSLRYAASAGYICLLVSRQTSTLYNCI
jgi:endoglucanase